MLSAQNLIIFCLALGAACGSDKEKKEEMADTTTAQEPTEREMRIASENNPEQQFSGSPNQGDTLYRISGTEPFWSLVIAKPQIVFTSMEGDTLTFLYQEPRKASGRTQEHVQVFELGGTQHIILRQAKQCPCSDGMSNKEYPYQATLILDDRILDGCARAGDEDGDAQQK